MQLLTHQSTAKTKLLPNKVGALFMKMGTGKTRVSVDLVNAVPDVDLVVWIGPLRTIKPLHSTIKPISEEISKWGGFNCQNVVYIGIETIQSSDRQYLQLYNKIQQAWRCFLIVDESITIKNMDAKRTSRLIDLGKMVEYKLILNGEPITKNLLDLYSQINFLSPRILNMGLAEFKSTYCCTTKITKHFGTSFKAYTKEFITGYENIDHLYSLIGEYVFECDLELNLERFFTEMRYTLDEESEVEYTRLKEKYLDNEKLMMMNNNIFLEMTQKMQHGYCITESKFDCVSEWFKTYSEDKSIIFCKYIASAQECKKRYPKATVLNYQSGCYSYNLQHLPYMVMFDKTFDWGKRVQGLARNFRTGSNGDYRVLDLTGNVGLEKLINDNNQKKLSTAEYLKTISIKKLKEIL